MTLYDRLNLIGVMLSQQQRDTLGAVAQSLRAYGRTTFLPNGDVLMSYDDELGELADMLDNLAGPITVQR